MKNSVDIEITDLHAESKIVNLKNDLKLNSIFQPWWFSRCSIQRCNSTI